MRVWRGRERMISFFPFCASSFSYCPIEWMLCVYRITFAWILKIQFISNVKGRTFMYGSLNTLFQTKGGLMLYARMCWCSHIKSTKTSPKHKPNPHHRNLAVVWFLSFARACYLFDWGLFCTLCVCVSRDIAEWRKKCPTQMEIDGGKIESARQ